MACPRSAPRSRWLSARLSATRA